MECYVISPNIYNDGYNYADEMFKNGIAAVGWSEKYSKGKQFKSIRNGDCIIVAQRSNWTWEYYYMGIVVGEEKFPSLGRISKRLSPIIKFDNKHILDLEEWSAGGANLIPSPQRIDKYKGVNNSIIKQIENILNMKKYIDLLTSNHNLILTGAPGTGKTYLAKQIAQQMIFGEIKEEMTPAEEVQFNEQCGFVQFHPSYDYTDFVEGLRPIQDENNKQIGFERKNGVFKEFCKKAIISNSAYESVLSKLNSDPTVWKVSLMGAGKNPIRKDCLENGYIRIGWHEYGDVEDFYDFDNFTYGGKNVLRAFQSQMKVGDIVVSCWSNKEVDAIGIITGEYEYRNVDDEYPRYRKVDWLVKDFCENIVELNGKNTFTPSTVYKAGISVENVLKLVTKYNSNFTINKKNFVFIIDEINRGEISKIFGELFFSIDSGYRGIDGKVKTQYQNLVEQGDVFYDGFYVPENVYIIGTMNDIDRSVESMDFAFRRRFAFKEIKATDRVEMLYDTKKGLGSNAKTAEEKMNALNAEIEKTEGLSSAYHIGPAYFLKLKNYNGDFNQLWENHLDGLLREYLRGMQDVEKNIDKLKKTYGYPSNKNND